MNIAVKIDATATDIARIGDHVIRVLATLRCPHCLRGRLRASGVHEVGENEFAWTCTTCHRDVVTVTHS